MIKGVPGISFFRNCYQGHKNRIGSQFPYEWVAPGLTPNRQNTPEIAEGGKTMKHALLVAVAILALGAVTDPDRLLDLLQSDVRDRKLSLLTQSMRYEQEHSDAFWRAGLRFN